MKSAAVVGQMNVTIPAARGGWTHARDRILCKSSSYSQLLKKTIFNSILLGECSALWASVSEALCMVGVYVSSHRKLIGHIGCCRSPQLLAFSAGRAHTG